MSEPFYVGRPSFLSSPYAVGVDGNKAEVIERYRKWLIAGLTQRSPAMTTAFLGIRPKQSFSCKGDDTSCHPEVIASLLSEGMQEQIRQSRVESLRYAGIGSRKTPQPILDQMEKLSRRLFELGYTLISGGAEGADTAFEKGCSGKKEIYLPWPGFQKLHGNGYVSYPSAEAFRVAEAVHPAWGKLKDSVKSLMARNSHQVLGGNLRSPVDFVVCWTEDGCESEMMRTPNTGGTSQAISLADRWGIPVINLKHGKEAMDRLAAIVKK